MGTMNVSLPEPLKAFVEEQAAQRGYGTTSEYVRGCRTAGGTFRRGCASPKDHRSGGRTGSGSRARQATRESAITAMANHLTSARPTVAPERLGSQRHRPSLGGAWRTASRLALGALAAVALATGVLLAAPEGGGSGTLTEHSFVYQGRERSYLLYAPRGAERLEGKRPLVLAIHGGAGSDRSMMRLTRGGFDSLADRDGFFVVYPNAVARYWDFGEGAVSEALPQRADDLGYFRAVLDQVSERYPVDPRRVFATGISRGGQASYFLACKLAGRIRAIAAFSMPLPDFLEDDCTAGPPVGVAIVNGTADPLVPYGGGRIEVLGHDRGAVLSTDATAALFRRRDGCAAKPTGEETLDGVDDGTRVEKTTWASCDGAPVVVYRVEGGGHTWPSGVQYLPERVVGKVTREVDGAAVAWEFFRSFR